MKRLVPSIVRGRSSCHSSRSVDGWPDGWSCCACVFDRTVRPSVSNTRTESGMTSKIDSSCATLRLRVSRSSSRSLTSLPAKSKPRRPDSSVSVANVVSMRRRPSAMLERHARRRRRARSAQRGVDVVGEIGERIRKCVVDRDLRRRARRDPRQLTVPDVRVDEPQIAVEDRDGKRHRLEQRFEANAGDSNAREIEVRRAGRGGRG